MKKLLLLLLQIPVLFVSAQEWPVKSQVTNLKTRNIRFTQLPSFSFVADKVLAQRGNYQELRLHPQFRQQVLQLAPDALRIELPLGRSETITLELVRFSLGNIKFTENNTEAINNIDVPLTYRGIVSGERQKHSVMLTVNKDYVSLLATLPGKVVQVTKADEKDPAVYRLYNSGKVKFPELLPIDCGTKKNVSRTPDGIDLTGVRQANVTAVQDKCVNVFVECFDSLYQWQGSNRQQTVNYVTELFTHVATGFFNDSINILIAGVNVWTTADPYRGDNRDNALADLAANYQDNFWGNICVGLDRSSPGFGRSGLAGDIGRVKGMAPSACPAYTTDDHPFCYNDMNYNVTVQNFPTGPSTTQQQVYLVLHEMGHLLGANHTKWCGWKLSSNPDVFGTLDSCGVIEGMCAQGPPPPATGATIMSYCVTGNSASDFVNFNNGFGLLPGNAIRNFVNNTACIGTCLDCIGALPGRGNDWALLRSRLRFFSPPQPVGRSSP